MREPKWISMEAVLAIHDKMILMFGGAAEVRDPGLLESALNRPKNAFHYEPDCSIQRLAALYAHGISRNHPFLDGNKRTAFTTAVVFLGLNGHWVAAPEMEAAL